MASRQMSAGQRKYGLSMAICSLPCAVWAIVSFCMHVMPCQADAFSEIEGKLCVHNLSVGRYSSMYHPRLYTGFLATDGNRSRVAFFWVEPTSICEQTDNLACCDFLFLPDRIVYWCHADKVHTHALSPASRTWQFPRDNKLNSILQCIFGVVAQRRTASKNTADDGIEMVRFFQQGRGHSQFDRTVGPIETPDSTSAETLPQEDLRILDQLPFGRVYAKQADQADGTIVWSLSKATAPKDLVKVVIKPAPSHDTRDWSGLFDPNTLGQWPAVPELYRQYWAFKDRSIKLQRDPNVSKARRLHTDITSALHGALPDGVDLALHKMRFLVALEAASDEAISSSTQTYFAIYANTAQEPVDRIIAELGRITKKLRKIWPEDQTRDFVLPLLKPLIKPKVFSDPGFVKDAVIAPVNLFGLSWYAQLVMNAIEDAGCLEPRIVARLREEIRPPRSAKAKAGLDPNALSPSMRRLLEHTETGPPAGSLTYGTLAHLLDETLRESFPADGNEPGHTFCGDVLESVRLFAGEGPFAGDAEKLKDAVSAFGKRYHSPRVTTEQASRALATLMALSFFDTSTQKDHNCLASQLEQTGNMLGEEVAKILRSHDCEEEVGTDQAAGIVADGIARFRELICDPLWPMFKFPLSRDEHAGLDDQLRRALRDVAAAAETLHLQMQEGADTSRSQRMLELQITYLVNRIVPALIRLRSPRARIAMTGSRRSLPLIIVQGQDNRQADQSSDFLQEVKSFYLGRTMQAHPQDPSSNPRRTKGRP